MNRAGRSSRPVWVATALGAVVVAGCARQGAPTGGVEDRVPPVVISVEPDTFAVVEPGLDRFRVRFSERISEQSNAGTLESVVQISPEIDGIRVDHKRDGIDIHLDEGLRPGITYRIRILPELRDMFGNPMAVPFEWAVSTGGAFARNAVVGQVWDRTSGEPVRDARVVLTGATPPPDDEETLRYVAASGEEGFYALRILPVGDFRLVAFEDVNGDREIDPTEPVGETVGTLGATDTLFVGLPVLLPDTTAAIFAQVEVVDSVTLRLLFDDFVDPTVPPAGVGVVLAEDTAAAEAIVPDTALLAAPATGAGTVTVPRVRRIFHEFEWAAYSDSVLAARDTALALEAQAALEAGDTLRSDDLEEERAQLSARARRPSGLQGDPLALLPDGTPVPFNSLVVLLDGPFPVGVSVRVEAGGIVNLHGLADGGGTVTTVWIPEPPDSSAVDSTTVPEDTLQTLPDTAAFRRLGLRSHPLGPAN